MKLLIIFGTLTLGIINCNNTDNILKKLYFKNKTVFHKSSKELKENYNNFSKHFTVKMVDASFSIDRKIIKDFHKYENTKDIRKVLDWDSNISINLISESIYSYNYLNKGQYSWKEEKILFCPDSTYDIKNMYHNNYTEILSIDTLDTNWYFILLNKTIF